MATKRIEKPPIVTKNILGVSLLARKEGFMVRYGSEAEAFAARMGLYLKRKLKENRLTQEEFAELFDCDVKSVSRWINGGITSMVKAERIAGYFGDTVRGIVLNEDDASFRFFEGKSEIFAIFLNFLHFFRK